MSKMVSATSKWDSAQAGKRLISIAKLLPSTSSPRQPGMYVRKQFRKRPSLIYQDSSYATMGGRKLCPTAKHQPARDEVASLEGGCETNDQSLLLSFLRSVEALVYRDLQRNDSHSAARRNFTFVSDRSRIDVFNSASQLDFTSINDGAVIGTAFSSTENL